MISDRAQPYLLTDDNLTRCREVVTTSGAVAMIEALADRVRGSGGRPRSTRRYTVTAVLTAALAILRVGRVPSLAEIHRVIATLTTDQLADVGMDAANTGGTSDYKAFHGWLTRLLVPLDPGWDLPARRVSNRDHEAALAARDPDQLQAAEEATRHLHEVVNALVAASAGEKAPPASRGDLLADETIIDLAGQSSGMGSRPDKCRGAAYAGRYYARDGSDNDVLSSPGKARQLKKTAVGIGVTAVSRVGPPDALYAIPPVITGVAIHPPTSGSVAGLAEALRHHRTGGFDNRGGPRARVPYLSVDMGYSTKDGFNDLLLDSGYAPVNRYPSAWNLVWGSEGPENSVGDVPAGPVQVSGEFYCPAVRGVLDEMGVSGGATGSGKGNLLFRTADLLAATRHASPEDQSAFAAQDARIAAVFPYLMGVNSRPSRTRRRPGRPRKAAAAGASTEQDTRVSQELVCPAVQGRVSCPLKPASQVNVALGIPEVKPPWPAERYRCCSHSVVTVSMSPAQFKRSQWGLVPGSWEHGIYLEAARSATEQRFSILKNQHITGIEHLKWSPRRAPMIYLIIGLWVAATNLAIRDAHAAHPLRPSSTVRKLRELERDLGRPATRIPPRT